MWLIAHFPVPKRRARWSSVHTVQKLHPLGPLPKHTHIHLLWAGVGEVAAPIFSPAGGLHTPPAAKSVKMPAQSHLGEAKPVAPDGPASLSRQARGIHPWREHNGVQPAGRRGQVQIILLIVQNGKQASQDKEGVRRSDWRISSLLFFAISHRLSTENFISLFSTSQGLSAKVFASDIPEWRVLPFTAGYESQENTHTPLSPLSPHS